LLLSHTIGIKNGGSDVFPGDPHLVFTPGISPLCLNVADDMRAILIMDQAGWHVSNALAVPENITINPAVQSALDARITWFSAGV
jgi:hypothetical protein